MRAIPDPGADFVQQQVTADFKEEVAEKENSSEKSKLLAGDSQLLVHCQCREPNVDPVEKADDVQQEKKGKNPEPHFPNRSCLDETRSDWPPTDRAHLPEGCTRIQRPADGIRKEIASCIRVGFGVHVTRLVLCFGSFTD